MGRVGKEEVALKKLIGRGRTGQHRTEFNRISQYRKEQDRTGKGRAGRRRGNDTSHVHGLLLNK